MKRLTSLIVLLLGLTPLIWFFRRPGILITGSDTNFPLNPDIWFRRRFFVWTSVGNAGSDFSSSTAGTFFHFIQYLPYKLGLSLQNVEIFSLLFWSLLIIFSAYIFARIILPKRTIPQLLFVVFYSFNIYLFNTWENVKVANLSLVAGIPIGLSILTLLKEKRISKLHALLLSIVNGVVLSGAGINPAYLICYFMILTIYMLGMLFADLNKRNAVGRVSDLLVLSFGVLLINLFWILPTLSFIFSNITGSGSIDKIGYTNWIDSLSENTSLLNIIRLQGAWDWYSVDAITKIPLYIPYAVNYFFNPVFIVFSFFVPSICLLSFLFKDAKKNYLYIAFALMFVLGVFLGTGTHLPTGSLFRFFSIHIPFFTLFRSPWYIFTPLVTVSISGLVALLFYNFPLAVKDRLLNKVAILVGVMLIVGNLIYTYPQVTGKIFRPQSHDNFYIRFPDYVLDTSKWLSSQNFDGRIIGYPDNEIERFGWGYNSIESVLNLFSDKEVLFASLNGPEAPIAQITREFYKSLQIGETAKVQALAAKLNISKIFYKADEETLSLNILPYLKLSNPTVFGKWYFYDFPSKEIQQNKVFLGDSIYTSNPYELSAKMLSVTPKDSILVDPKDALNKIIKNNTGGAGQIISAENSLSAELLNERTASYNLKSRLANKDFSKVIYSIKISQEGDYQPVLENHTLKEFGINIANGIEAEIDGTVTNLKLEKLNDSYIYFVPIHLRTGDHKLIINLDSQNLVSKNYSLKGDGNISNASDANGNYLSTVNKSTKDISLDYEVENFDPSVTYAITVGYKQIYGDNAAVLTEQKNPRTMIKSQTDRLPNYPEWGYFSFYYEPIVTDSSLAVRLLTPSIKDALGTKILYKDLSVAKVFTNDLFLVSHNLNDDLGTSGELTLKKVSPVEYDGEVTSAKGPQYIAFSENYSPEWRIEIQDNLGRKIDLKTFHFKANYYANGWYLENSPSIYKFKIYYKRQSLLKYGYIIGGVGTVIVVLLNLIYYRRKHGKA